MGEAGLFIADGLLEVSGDTCVVGDGLIVEGARRSVGGGSGAGCKLTAGGYAVYVGAVGALLYVAGAGGLWWWRRRRVCLCAADSLYCGSREWSDVTKAREVLFSLEALDKGEGGAAEVTGDGPLGVVFVVIREERLQFGDLSSCCGISVAELQVAREVGAVGSLLGLVFLGEGECGDKTEGCDNHRKHFFVVHGSIIAYEWRIKTTIHRCTSCG